MTAALPRPELDRRRILCVDDEEGVTRALRRTLSREGYEVSTRNSPEDALALLKTESFDMIISDYRMPGMTGVELTRICRDRYPEMMRLILTGQADTNMAIEAINQGEVYRFISKPWDDIELKVTLFMAFEQLELLAENRRLLAALRQKQALIEQLERAHPGIGSVVRDDSGAILLDAS
jgi:DNA-binding NtrC family response regulator